MWRYMTFPGRFNRQTYLKSLSTSPLARVAMMDDYDERAQYIHEARPAVRSDKDREVEAKLAEMQEDFERRDHQRRVWAAFCQSFDSRLRNVRPHPSPDKSAAYEEADHQLDKCRDRKHAFAHAEAEKLYHELLAVTGLPLN
jgi:hypothetical protein